MMYELQPYPKDGQAVSPTEPATTIMTRLEHWRHVLKQIERDAADARYAEIKLLVGMAILAVEDAMVGGETIRA